MALESFKRFVFVFDLPPGVVAFLSVCIFSSPTPPRSELIASVLSTGAEIRQMFFRAAIVWLEPPGSLALLPLPRIGVRAAGEPIPEGCFLLPSFDDSLRSGQFRCPGRRRRPTI